MFLLIDNYDSFTYNLYHYLGELGAHLVVKRNDALTVAEAVAMTSAGHHPVARPLHAERSRHLPRARSKPPPARCRSSASASAIRRIGQAFGGKVVRAPAPMHGKLSQVSHHGNGVFAGHPDTIHGARAITR